MIYPNPFIIKLPSISLKPLAKFNYLYKLNLFIVCDQVCKRSHRVGNENLTVQIYHECLGQPNTSGEWPRFKTPKHLIVKDIDVNKMKFAHQSREFKDYLDKQIEIGYGKIQWPEIFASELIVECTLTKDVNDCRKLMKTWEKDMEGDIKKMFEELQVKKISVLQEPWKKVLEKIEQVKADPTKAALMIENSCYTITIVGFKTNAESLMDSMQQIITAVKDEIQKQKLQVKENVKLKYFQIRLIIADNFKESTEKNYPGLKVTIDSENNFVNLEGQVDEVSLAKMYILERCNEICVASAGKFSQTRKDYLSKKVVKTTILSMLKDIDNRICFEFKGDEVMLYAFSDDKVVDAAHLLKDTIVESPVDVPPDSAYLLNSDKLEQKLKAIESMEEFKGLLQVIAFPDQTKILIVTFNNLVGLSREFVEDFLQECKILSNEKEVNSSIFKYLELHHSKKIQEICTELKEEQCQITTGNNKFFIKGTQRGLHQAMREIEGLVTKVLWKKHTLLKPGITKHLKTEPGAEYIAKVQRNHRCYIQMGPETPAKISSSRPVATESLTKGKIAEYTTKSGISIKVQEGDLTTLPVDVIVNGANTDLKHQGGLAGVLVKKGWLFLHVHCFLNITYSNRNFNET